jgi:hypothetical protein
MKCGSITIGEIDIPDLHLAGADTPTQNLKKRKEAA